MGTSRGQLVKREKELCLLKAVCCLVVSEFLHTVMFFLRFSYAIRDLSVLLSICSMLLEVKVFVSKRTALRAFQIECLVTVYNKTSRSVCDITFGGKINWTQSSKDGFK